MSLKSRNLKSSASELAKKWTHLKRGAGALSAVTLKRSPKLRQWAGNWAQFKVQARSRIKAAKKLPRGEMPSVHLPADEKGFFKTEDGTSIYYEVVGKGRPLIFCYGLVCRREHWHHQIKHFKNTFKVITFDYRGHHCSGSPANDQNLTLEWCARDIIKLMEHLGIEQAVGLGHSLGVAVLTHVARLAPEKLKGMVLVCGSVMNPFQKMFFSNRMDFVYHLASAFYDYAPAASESLWRRLTERSRLNFFITSSFGFNPSLAEEEDILLYMEGVSRCTPATFYGLLRDYTSFDGREMLKKIQLPVLLIAGEEDCITPMEIQEEMAQLLPHGRIRKIAQGSHNAHMEHPRIVNDEIESFLKQLDYL
jgi:pimeloyl-ACP methyl ester carboxylesterase